MEHPLAKACVKPETTAAAFIAANLTEPITETGRAISRVLALTQPASDIGILNIASLHNVSTSWKQPWKIRPRRPAKPQLYTSLPLLADKLQKPIAESSIHKSRIKNRLVRKASKNAHYRFPPYRHLSLRPSREGQLGRGIGGLRAAGVQSVAGPGQNNN